MCSSSLPPICVEMAQRNAHTVANWTRLFVWYFQFKFNAKYLRLYSKFWGSIKSQEENIILPLEKSFFDSFNGCFVPLHSTGINSTPLSLQVTKSAEAVIAHINNVTSSVREKCVTYKLDKVTDAMKSVANNKLLTFKASINDVIGMMLHCLVSDRR